MVPKGPYGVNLATLQIKQLEIATNVKIFDDFDRIETVGGVDVSYKDQKAQIGYCILDLETGAPVIEGSRKARVSFPYIPTYLAFREFPLIRMAVRAMSMRGHCPDILMIDGQGILHPRMAGLATHVGVELDIPTIGVAKKRLVGEQREILHAAGDYAEVHIGDELRGYALLSSSRAIRPIYVSPGHRVGFETSLEIVLRFCNTKIPEPIRRAHVLSRKRK
jgi:deoxyribonuclease V